MCSLRQAARSEHLLVVGLLVALKQQLLVQDEGLAPLARLPLACASQTPRPSGPSCRGGSLIPPRRSCRAGIGCRERPLCTGIASSPA